MKTICCLFFLLGVPPALAQVAPAPVDLADPESLESNSACLADCERVFADCKVQCVNTSARAHDRDSPSPDDTVGTCIDRCQVDLKLCNEDC